MAEPMWATGPGEILRHGISLLDSDSDTNRRLAMISIDNSVELMMQTYITLPKRVTGINISRSDRDKICSNFPSLLDGIEEHASEKIIGIDLGEIEWFHRLRNELYHQGNGLTVERSKVEFYAELAKLLFENLYGSNLEIKESRDMKSLGNFMADWIEIEKLLSKWDPDNSGHFVNMELIIKNLIRDGQLSEEQYHNLREIHSIRNQVIHGKVQHKEVITGELLQKAKTLVETLLNASALIL